MIAPIRREPEGPAIVRRSQRSERARRPSSGRMSTGGSSGRERGHEGLHGLIAEGGRQLSRDRILSLLRLMSFIPALAGEPSARLGARRPPGAYPRGRGGGFHRRRPQHLEGPIPAGAGEPPPTGASTSSDGAYPRGRGGAAQEFLAFKPSVGLSPRTRGSRSRLRLRRRRGGPIPADAGEPRLHQKSKAVRRAYPRGRGGALPTYATSRNLEGLSPRTRGSRWQGQRGAVVRGPIPADAGEPSAGARSRTASWAYPRGRGGAVSSFVKRHRSMGLSPRTRGSRVPLRRRLADLGPIPADAGEPLASVPSRVP